MLLQQFIPWRVSMQKIWSFIYFLPLFLLLLILGLLKAVIVGPVVTVIILIGNSSVILGLWPAHVFWTYYCVAKTKKFGLVLKILVLISLPLPLVLWPIFAIVGSLLAGVGYGYFTPLIATFEAAGNQVENKLLHCVVDGSWSTIEGSCTVVRDFTDFCFHSYFSYMDELTEEVPEDEKPMSIKLWKLPACLFVSLLAVPVDVLLVTAVALWKSPLMLFKGWKRLLEDLIGREGPFLEAACVPFAGLAIILWPLAVVGAVISAFFCSFFLASYSGIVVYQENSPRMGLAFIISVIALFDEYTNDLLYLREGSCLPRPKYRKQMNPPSDILERRKSTDNDENDSNNGRIGPHGSKLVSERTRTLKIAIQQLKPMQVWDWLFRSCEVNGRILLHDGLLTRTDIEECIVKGKCKKLEIKLPAWSILQCLLVSAKSNSSGLLISDELELTRINWPKDKVLEWFMGPLLTMKEQIKGLQLNENEESCLRGLIMNCKNERPEDWNDTEFPSDDNIRRAQLQAILRRLQGIVSSMSRMPTFRRRFRSLLKVLYIELMRIDALRSEDLTQEASGNNSANSGERRGKDVGGKTYNNEEIV
ncbi:uncharacterized membrane protein At3g27390 [Telopea speciosissima]|uniref:uncharacterized membrane protein At3g27390 n=1 Tax=Telopea speciosissima TaxID=54955 RepID=UPI001CC54BC2|nr:uncharacterized membrane protein At3g27390 [Telopea speciosissima]